MLKARAPQRSFLDADQIAESLIPADSFYRRFRELVWPLIRDDDFASLYCARNGRPAISPALLAMASILQFHENLSDRELEAACRFDLRIKYALGLAIDERPFDHSSLGDFRDRLLKHEHEKAIFNRIVEALVAQGLIDKNEPQRIDATHVIADVAIPSMITLVKKAVHEVLKPLEKRHGEHYQRIAQDIDLPSYSKEKVNQNHPGRPDEAKHASSLVKAVTDARKVVSHASAIADPAIQHPLNMLRRILQENIEDGETGAPQEKAHKDKPRDLLVSPIDADARYGAKSATKKFTGYKANVTESVGNRFITNIKAMHGNRPDGETMVQAITEQQIHQINPAKIIGDTAYSDADFRKALNSVGVTVVAPLRPANPRTNSIYPKSMFVHDEDKQTLTCPAGVTVQEFYYDRSIDRHMFHFPMTSCGPCVQRPQCTNAREKRRVVGIDAGNKELRQAEIYNKTAAFKADMRLRPAIEGKLSELVRYHGMRRSRYRGLRKLQLQCNFTAAAVNLKRWIKVEQQFSGPPISKAA